ncbi:MAG: VWA domain-containing protein [Polyangiaceae bacterium]|nr:VWA domain-containing protein [Polyangiaceae bacterium]
MKKLSSIVAAILAVQLCACSVRVRAPKITVDVDGVANTTVKSFGEISTETGGVSLKAKGAAQLPDQIITVFKRGVPKDKPIDLVFVVDTTGSMQDDIDEARRKMKQIVRALDERNPDHRVGVVAYRDLDDVYVAKTYTKLQAGEGKVLRSLDRLKADGGGDFPEHVYAGLVEALKDQPWRDEASHHILVIGDAPPHDDYKKDKKHSRAAVRKLAKEKEVKIHTIGVNCSGAC